MKWKGWIGGVLLVMMLFGTLPCLPGGNIEQSPEVYAEIRRQWLSKQN